MRIGSKILSALSLMLCLTTFAFPALGAPGDLDPTFGTGGVVITDLSGNYKRIHALALQPDGKILAAGVVDYGDDILKFALARYNPNGSLDTSFGNGGLATVGNRHVANAGALQPDGKIVVGGNTYAISSEPSETDFALARYNPDGSIDTGFGNGGLVNTNFNLVGDIHELRGLAIQPDGKILAGGFANGNFLGYVFALARYNPDGSLDTSFGNGGLVNTNFNGYSAVGEDIALQPDGKILVAGHSNRGWTLARYNPNGSLDTSFGNGGLAPGVFYGSSAASALTLQSDGKIVLVGAKGGFALARYNPDGSLDTGFGTSGTVVTGSIYNGEARDVVIQPNGKIVVAGWGWFTPWVKMDFVLARYNPDGSTDADFGNGGIVYTPLTSAKYDMGYALLLQPDGKIVAGGAAGETGDGTQKFGLARYFGDIPPLPTNKPPIAAAGDNRTITSEQQSGTIIQGIATDPDHDSLTYRWLENQTVLLGSTPVGTSGEAHLNLSNLPVSLTVGAHTLTLEVSDGKAPPATDDMILTIDNSAPHAAPSGSGTYQIGEQITVGGQVSDFDGDGLTYRWFEGTTAYCNGVIPSTPGGAGVDLPPCNLHALSLGTHTIWLAVSDPFNAEVASDISITVKDGTAPTIKPEPNVTILWPPNHKMVNISIKANAIDDSGLPVTLSAAVTSNEPQNGLGDGDMAPDWTDPVITDGVITLQLRAERSGSGDGRVYTVTITAADGSGNSSTAKLEIIVPHDKGK